MKWLESLFGDKADGNKLTFHCNICGHIVTAAVCDITRENAVCRCGSSVRLRSLIHLLSVELFGESLALPDFPHRPDLAGIDMSGAATYAERLREKLGYTNTFLHKTPHLDITVPDATWFDRCDFVISSDVFEHVTPPVSVAFENTLHLLKPGGLFVFTVPYTKTGETLEHFPELHIFHIESRRGSPILINKTRHGVRQEFSDLVFHGGEGETLEMRVFSEAGVLQELENAGFTDIRIRRESCQQYGILWEHDWSLPITARRPLT